MSIVHIISRGSGFHFDEEENICCRTLDFMEFPGYRVGDDGSVWTRRKQGRYNKQNPFWNEWRKLSPGKLTDHGHGSYLYVHMATLEGKTKNFLVHRLVLLAFVGPCPEGMQCRHFPDDTKTNNYVSNLSWGTPMEDAADRKFHGTLTYDHPNRPRGTGHHKAKLNDELVRQIRADAASDQSYGWISRLSRKYQISRLVIAGIINGKYWKHVE